MERNRAFFTNPSSVNTQPYKATPDRNIIFAPFWDRKRGCRREIVITSSTIYRGKTLVFFFNRLPLVDYEMQLGTPANE